MKRFHLAIASIIAIAVPEMAQAASISNSSLPVVDENTPDQQNVSLDRGTTRDGSSNQTSSSYSNYPTDKDYPQGQSDKETISNSFIGVLESNTSGEIDVINSSVGLVNPKDADKVNLINSSVGVVRSKNNPKVNTSNSRLGAIESTDPKNQQSSFPGGMEPPQGNPFGSFGPGIGGSGGSSGNYPKPNYPTDKDHASGASRLMSPFAGGQSAAAKAVPEPSSAFATLLTGALAGGLILKRKLKREKPVNW